MNKTKKRISTRKKIPNNGMTNIRILKVGKIKKWKYEI